MPKIHSSSVVSSQAEIADDAEIGPFCLVEDNVVIGSGTKLFNHVSVYNGARIGKNNKIFAGAGISAIPQDLKFGGEYTEVIIGDNNSIRECVTIHRATVHAGKTVIGNDCLLMAYSHVAHDCTLADNCIIANSVALAGHVHLEEFAILGGLTGVHQFVKVGKHCMIGAHSMVVKDVPPYALYSGNPLEFEGLNVKGLRRRDFSPDAIDLLKQAYNLIFKSGLNVSQAVEKIKLELTLTEEINNLLSFIESSSRGISK